MWAANSLFIQVSESKNPIKNSFNFQFLKGVKQKVHLSFELGVFTATKAGTYMFSTHALARLNYGNFRMKKNDDVICDTWVEDDVGDVSACSTVTHLDLGDEVKVTGDNDEPAEIFGDRSGFSGILIYPD